VLARPNLLLTPPFLSCNREIEYDVTYCLVGICSRPPNACVNKRYWIDRQFEARRVFSRTIMTSFNYPRLLKYESCIPISAKAEPWMTIDHHGAPARNHNFQFYEYGIM
jgi:hypothetical protein